MAHTCNSNYSGDRDWEDSGSRPAQAYSSRDLISINKRLDGVPHTYHPRYSFRNVNKRAAVQAILGIK
jgi:hypothetical protein